MKFVTMRLTEKTNRLSKQVAKRTGMHQYAVLERAMQTFASRVEVTPGLTYGGEIIEVLQPNQAVKVRK